MFSPRVGYWSPLSPPHLLPLFPRPSIFSITNVLMKYALMHLVECYADQVTINIPPLSFIAMSSLGARRYS